MSRRLRVVFAAALFLSIWGVKLLVIDRFGSDVPYWDQWPREAVATFVPFFERGEFWRLLFDAHNEHRIAPTLLVNLGLVIVSGQWDARLQLVVNAAVHAAIAVGLLGWAFRQLERSWALATVALLVLVFAPPIASENILAGFQSQFYFLIGFSLLAIGGLLGAPAFSPGWWGGFAAGLVAIVSMGSGFLCAAPVAAMAAARWFRGAARRDALATIAAALTLAAIGARLHSPAPWHDGLRAHHAGEFLTYAARCLSWPLRNAPWLVSITWLPWCALLVQRLATFRREDDRSADFVLAAGAWVLAQAAAVSYARGGASALPPTRYGDVFAVGVVLAFWALALLARHLSRRPGTTLRVVWLAYVVTCTGIATREVWHGDMPSKKAENLAYERNVHDFVLTNDASALAAQTLLPFPDAAWLAERLRGPAIRSRLPVSIAAPIANDSIDEAAKAPAASLPHRRVQIVASPGEWRSAPFSPSRGWWKIETAGNIGSANASLQLIAAASGRVLATIAPTKPTGNGWRAAYVRAPREPAVLVARVRAAGPWLGFSDPIVMSSLSYRAWMLAKYGAWIALFGGAGLIVAIACTGRKAHDRATP